MTYHGSNSLSVLLENKASAISFRCADPGQDCLWSRECWVPCTPTGAALGGLWMTDICGVCTLHICTAFWFPLALTHGFSLPVVCTDPLCSCAGVRGARCPSSLPSPRSGARPPAASLHMPALLLPVGRAPGGGGVPPEADAPHQHPPGRGDCLPGHGHAPARAHGLDHHALLPWPPVLAGPQEAGEVRGPPPVLRHDDADRHTHPSRQLHLQAGAQQEPAAPQVGGDAQVDPGVCWLCHFGRGLPCAEHFPGSALLRQRKPSDRNCNNHQQSSQLRSWNVRGRRKRRRNNSNNNGALAAFWEPELTDFFGGGLRSFMVFSTRPQWALCKHPAVTVPVSCIYRFANTILWEILKRLINLLSPSSSTGKNTC